MEIFVYMTIHFSFEKSFSQKAPTPPPKNSSRGQGLEILEQQKQGFLGGDIFYWINCIIGIKFDKLSNANYSSTDPLDYQGKNMSLS